MQTGASNDEDGSISADCSNVQLLAMLLAI